ncbi:hypothetical protein [Paenibacillus sp. Soil522]|uniref:hypothetical protein n=1 Tax=Paenibacillus sp. Soil522 TaxID=1736388 RepID=UPI0012DD99A7|nr:hypothetical protein [Paenibacillus sp. Soil522]
MTNKSLFTIDDSVTHSLQQIARNHLKLTLEHSSATTTTERRKAIMSEVEVLKVQRDNLLGRKDSVAIS